jgi:hypothetical protein
VDPPTVAGKHIGVLLVAVDRVQRRPQAVHARDHAADLREHPVTPSLHRAYDDNEIHEENLVFIQRCGRTGRASLPPLDGSAPGTTGETP